MTVVWLSSVVSVPPKYSTKKRVAEQLYFFGKSDLPSLSSSSPPKDEGKRIAPHITYVTQLNIAYPEYRSQQIIEIDDEKKLCVDPQHSLTILGASFTTSASLRRLLLMPSVMSSRDTSSRSPVDTISKVSV